MIGQHSYVVNKDLRRKIKLKLKIDFNNIILLFIYLKLSFFGFDFVIFA